MEKVCYECKKCLPIEEFVKNNSRKSGYRNLCKLCKKEQSKAYRVNSAEKVRQYEESRKEAKKTYLVEYHKRNKDTINKNKRLKRKLNPIEVRGKFTDRYYRDNQFRIAHVFRTRIRKALLKGYKTGKSVELLGCTAADLKAHLESKFLPTMTWENYGHLWHMDHIIPCVAFDLTHPEQQRKCFHYTNIQPLFATTTVIDGVEYIGNIEKGNKLIPLP